MHTDSRRRWRHHPTTIFTDGLVWAAWLFITAAVLLVLCLAITAACPS